MSERVDLIRIFKMGATCLPDVNEKWTPEQVLAAYAPNYPFLANATLSEPEVEGNTLVYTIRKPIAQTKGASNLRRKALDDALEEIRVWGQRPVANPDTVVHWVPVLQLIDHKLRDGSASAAILDPYFVPLA
jgi:PRTRC genetic system protein C